MLGLKLNHVSKRGHRENHFTYLCLFIYRISYFAWCVIWPLKLLHRQIGTTMHNTKDLNRWNRHVSVPICIKVIPSTIRVFVSVQSFIDPSFLSYFYSLRKLLVRQKYRCFNKDVNSNYNTCTCKTSLLECAMFAHKMTRWTKHTVKPLI